MYVHWHMHAHAHISHTHTNLLFTLCAFKAGCEMLSELSLLTDFNIMSGITVI